MLFAVYFTRAQVCDTCFLIVTNAYPVMMILNVPGMGRLNSLCGVSVPGCGLCQSLDVGCTSPWICGVSVLGCALYQSLDMRCTSLWMCGVSVFLKKHSPFMSIGVFTFSTYANPYYVPSLQSLR